ncbi:MAG: methyltransferase domain-containing protein [Asgard group archaeon]|nr:methyltransferase domain-containing protein [Asgard group archaeon]
MSNSKDVIKDRYAKALEKATESEESSCCPPQEAVESEESSCCGSTTETKKEVTMPSFGSSTNLAEKTNLSEGDIVVDLGSGPGYDLLSAAKIVGPNGMAIGIDFTPDMVDYATKKAEEMGLDNVTVYQGDIENLPLEDSIADVIISNCVINLTMDKQAVFNEAYRILKPGGRLVDADIIAGEELPESLRKDKDALCGCIGGALTEEGYVKKIRKAGFKDIKVDIESSNNINWKGQKIPMYSGIITATKPNN